MLHIILFILKIIGIILLSVLGILLLSILCALFVPVRYRIEVDRTEGEGNPPFTARVRITWFLHLVNVLICYPADVMVRVRLFIFTVFRIPEKDKKAKKTGKKKKNKQKNKKQKDGEEKSEAVSERIYTEEKTFTSFEEGVLEDGLPDDYSVSAGQEDADAAQAEKKTLSGMIRRIIWKIKEFVDKIKHMVEKIKAFFQNIQYTIRNFCDKIKSTLDNIQYYREVLESDPFKQSMNLCRGEIGYALKKLKPDKFDADFTVGMDDPAVLGQILAFYGMLYPLIGQQVRIAGDFESVGTHVEGRLYIRGRIRAFTFLRVALRIYLNRDVKTLIRLLKKEAV